MSNLSPVGLINCEKEKQQNLQKNKPVIANANFIIGSYHLLNKKKQLESFIKENPSQELESYDSILQGKEVEEWLMGSGLSIPEATTG